MKVAVMPFRGKASMVGWHCPCLLWLAGSTHARLPPARLACATNTTLILALLSNASCFFSPHTDSKFTTCSHTHPLLLYAHCTQVRPSRGRPSSQWVTQTASLCGASTPHHPNHLPPAAHYPGPVQAARAQHSKVHQPTCASGYLPSQGPACMPHPTPQPQHSPQPLLLPLPAV